MPLPVAFVSIPMVILCIRAAYVDLVSFRIPDLVNLSIFLLGVIAIGRVAPEQLVQHLIAAAIVLALAWSGSWFLYRRIGREAFGLGDVKLVGAATMWVGVSGLPSLLLVAAATGIAYAFIVGRQRKGIPFGPFLALGLVVVWLYGPISI